MPQHVTVADLQRDGSPYLGRRMRIACLVDFASAKTTGGIVLPKPTLQRSTKAELPTPGEQALERISFEKSTVRGAAIAQSRIIGGCYLLTLLVLQRSAPKFLSVEPA